MAFDYTTLITNEHANQPNFVASIQALTKPFQDAVAVLDSMPAAFDVDQALGAQLDIVALWVGATRRLSAPIPNSFFSWNTTGLGWNQANWKGPYTPSEGIVELDDETFRAIIKAKIGVNYWDGTLQSLNVIGTTAMAGLGIQAFVLDNQDMTETVYIVGTPTVALLALIKTGILPPKTAGLGITGYILSSVPGAPFFALSVTTTSLVGGLDFGAFGNPV